MNWLVQPPSPTLQKGGCGILDLICTGLCPNFCLVKCDALVPCDFCAIFIEDQMPINF